MDTLTGEVLIGICESVKETANELGSLQRSLFRLHEAMEPEVRDRYENLVRSNSETPISAGVASVKKMDALLALLKKRAA